MVMKRCNNGHFYDSDKYGQCPYCGISILTHRKRCRLSAPNRREIQPYAPETVGLETVASPTAASKGGIRKQRQNGRIYAEKKRVLTVVGWLCVHRRTFKGGRTTALNRKRTLSAERQTWIFQSRVMTAYREKNHAVISFNPKTAVSGCCRAKATGMVYLNDEEVYSASELFKGDVIELGQTKLKFVPFL